MPKAANRALMWVPGGRFNEMYGWDSYFIALGLLEHGEYKNWRKACWKTWLIKSSITGKMLNANRQLLPRPLAAAFLHALSAPPLWPLAANACRPNGWLSIWALRSPNMKTCG